MTRFSQLAAAVLFASSARHVWLVLSADVVTNSSGAIQNESDYYPYGGERVYTQTVADQNYKFTGKERDPESGLDNFGARYDSSNLGRFMTPVRVNGITQPSKSPATAHQNVAPESQAATEEINPTAAKVALHDTASSITPRKFSRSYFYTAFHSCRMFNEADIFAISAPIFFKPLRVPIQGCALYQRSDPALTGLVLVLVHAGEEWYRKAWAQ